MGKLFDYEFSLEGRDKDKRQYNGKSIVEKYKEKICFL